MNNIKIIHDTKFKNIFVSVRFLSVLNEESVLAKSVLANILNESCEKYPSKREVTEVLDQMYGAQYNTSTNVVGNIQIMVSKCKIINPSYIQNKSPLLEALFSLLYEFLLRPLLDEKGFDQRVFEEAKRNVKDMIVRANDDPSVYCMHQAMRVAGEGQPLGWGVYGDVEEVDAITMEEVMSLYKQMIHDDRVDILVLGDVKENEVMEYSKKYLPFTEKKEILECSYHLKNIVKDKVQYAYKDISQSYITYLYANHINNKDEDFASLRIANALLGQLPTSLLFQEVREKNSLCYSIYSALLPYDGTLGISTGVESTNIDKAKKIIEKQVERMKNGDFDDAQIPVAKKMLINSLRATGDDADSIFALAYRNLLFGRDESVQDLIDKIEKVEKEDVIQVMNKMELCLSYVVKAREENE